MTAKLRELLEASTLGGRPLPEGKSVADLVAETILRGALDGDIRFLTELLNRTEGKSSPKIEEPDGGREISLRWEDEQAIALTYGGPIQEELETN